MTKQRLQRCNARRRRTDAALYRADREGRLMEYLRSSGRCRNWPVRGKKRCRLHGGLSTGPKTSEGKARTVAAMVEGRRRLLEKLKAEGKPVPWGPKEGRREPICRRAPACASYRAIRPSATRPGSISLPEVSAGASSVPTGGERRFDAVVRHSGVARSTARS